MSKSIWTKSGPVAKIGKAILLTLLGLLPLLMLSPSSAQSLYGSITGTVLDSTGAAIIKVDVKATETKTGIVATAQTNESGNFLIQNLAPGVYSVQFSSPGLSTLTQSNVVVVQNNVRRLDVAMNVGAVTQEITVQAESALLQTDRADINQTVQPGQILTLPLSSTRNFQTLFELIPGFSAQMSTHSAAANPGGSLQYNVNGLSYSTNSTALDGASDVYQWIPDSILYVPPAESIESFNVVTANYTADQGNVGGAVTTIITKSGGDQFHGSLWEFHGDNALNAKPYFYTAARLNKSITNQFGVSSGGPIKHKKVFYFADWERTALRTGASTNLTLPTNALRSGDFTGTGTTIYDPATGDSTGAGRTPFANNIIPASRLSSAALKMLSYIPTVSLATGTSPISDYLFATTLPSTLDNVDGKLTYAMSDNTNIFLKYSTGRKNLVDPQAFGQGGGPTVDGGVPGNAPAVTQFGTIGASHFFSQSLIADGTVSYTRQDIAAKAADIDQSFGTSVLGIPGTNGTLGLQGGVPSFSFTSFTNFGTGNSNSPFSFRDTQLAIAGAVHWTKGNHTVSAGANLLFFQLAHFQTTGASFPARGGFSFNGGLTSLKGGASPNLYNSFADYLLGLPSSMGNAAQYSPYNHLKENEYAFYVEDQWQLLHRLTLNYGLRFEMYPFEHNPHYGGVLYNPSDNTVLIGGYGATPYNPGISTSGGYVTPRFGASYRISDKTVIRGGLSESVNPSNFKYALVTYPFVLQATYSAPNSNSAAGSLTTGIPSFPALPDITKGVVSVPSNFQISSYPKNFSRGHILSYNLMVEQQLLPWMSATVGYIGNSAVNQNAIHNYNAGEPGLGVSGQPFYQKFGTSTARNLYDPIAPSNFNALNAQLKVNGGGFSGSGVTYVYSKALGWAINEDFNLSYNSTDVLNRNYAVNSDDLKHNMKVFTVYHLPLGKEQRWVNHGIGSILLGGWSITDIVTKRSGTPFTVTASGSSLNSPGNTQTANQVLPSVAVFGAHLAGHHYFDPLAFQPVTTVNYGNVHLNNLRGPGTFRMDAGLRRTFTIREGIKGEFLAQAFSITNTPSFSNPGANVSNATFSGGSVTAYNGYDTITSAGGNRSAQFGLTIRY
jgi:hypothetical protein